MALQLGSGRWSDPRVRRSVLPLLTRTPLCALATVGSAGTPHVNTLYYAVSNALDLVFLSDPNSTHARNLRSRPRAAVAVFDSRQRWGGNDRGVQLFGRASEVANVDRRAAESAYAARFPLYRRWRRATSRKGRRLARELAELRFYRFRPSWLKLLDEEAFPGRQLVVRLPPRRGEGRNRP